jgi:translation initiation factor 1
MSEFDDFTNNTDPFSQLEGMIDTTNIHIRLAKRNARKSTCTIEGLEYDDDELKKMLKEMKKKFACNGTLIKDKELGNILQMQGDVRDQAKEYLMTNYNILDENIILHGFN